ATAGQQESRGARLRNRVRKQADSGLSRRERKAVRADGQAGAGATSAQSWQRLTPAFLTHGRNTAVILFLSPHPPRGARSSLFSWSRMNRSTLLAAAFACACLPLLASAGAIYPIDRAHFLAGSKFDFKVEFDRIVPAANAKVTINGTDIAKAFGKSPQYTENEDGSNASALVIRDVTVTTPGNYVVEASDGTTSQKVVWDVYGTGPRKAKNVILFIGDGMSVANRTAARILSKGIKEGRYYGALSIDDMPHMALIGTSGVDSIITDSANSMSAYTTGHKSSVNALGVYVARNKDNLAHPKVETITELVKRKTRMAVGIVSDAEIEDATPAGMVAHTRRRADKDIIA